MWLVGASGGIVVIEPAPYELVIALALLLFMVTGMTLRPAHLPLLLLLIAYNIGYLIGVVPVLTEEGTVMWAAVSSFMSLTTLSFALANRGFHLRHTHLLPPAARFRHLHIREPLAVDLQGPQRARRCRPCSPCSGR
jgi:hypothetical protein